jgi:quercetin dioxygenase-like cupin family protein
MVMDSTTVRPTVLTAEAMAALPVTSLGEGEGVTHTVLWRSDTSTAGRLTVPAGHRLGAHTHRVNHHHVWVVDGRVTILGTELGPGSYVHIPSGIEHDIDATNTDGCTLFYLYAKPVG